MRLSQLHQIYTYCASFLANNLGCAQGCGPERPSSFPAGTALVAVNAVKEHERDWGYSRAHWDRLPIKKYINNNFSPSFKLREDQIFLLQRFRTPERGQSKIWIWSAVVFPEVRKEQTYYKDKDKDRQDVLRR